MKHRHPFAAILTDTIQKQKMLTALLAAAIAGTIVTGIAPPLVLEQLINHLTEGASLLLPLALGYFAVTALAGIFDMAKESLITIFGQKVTHSLRTQMAEKVKRLPASYFIQNEPGVTTSRFVNDVNTVETLFASGVISMVADVCKVLSILVVVFVKSRGLGYLLILATPVLFLLTRGFQKRMLRAQMEHRIAVGRTNQQIPETLNNLRTIHVFHKEKYMEHRYDSSIQQSFRAMERSNFYDAIYSPIIITISAVLVAVMMICSVQGESFGQLFGMSVGTAVAVIAYVGKVFEPLESIGMEIQNIQSAVAGVERICEFLEEKERAGFEENGSSTAVQEEEENPECSVEGENPECPAVELRNVTFGYEEGQNLFTNYSLTIWPGEMVTLTGRTGAGKSTLFKLLLGLYQPQSGQVYLYGKLAEQISDSQKRHLFGYVEQNFRIIPGTVKEQITLKDDSVPEAQVIRALQMVGLYDMIEKMDEQLDTRCTPELFSQGQFQLLSIARAVVLEPEILLLDEITANLDSIMEAQVLATLRAASANRTVISISHRLYEQAGGRKIILGEKGATD